MTPPIPKLKYCWKYFRGAYLLPRYDTVLLLTPNRPPPAAHFVHGKNIDKLPSQKHFDNNREYAAEKRWLLP